MAQPRKKRKDTATRRVNSRPAARDSAGWVGEPRRVPGGPILEAATRQYRPLNPAAQPEYIERLYQQVEPGPREVIEPRPSPLRSAIGSAMDFGGRVADEFQAIPGNMRAAVELDRRQRAERGVDVAAMDSIMAERGVGLPREPWTAGVHGTQGTPYYQRVNALRRVGEESAEEYYRREREREAARRRK